MKRETAVEPSPPLAAQLISSGSDSDDAKSSARDQANAFRHESSEDELSVGDTIHGTCVFASLIVSR